METHSSHTLSLQVALTLRVGVDWRKVSVVPHSVLQHPSGPHISEHSVSHPPGLRARAQVLHFECMLYMWKMNVLILKESEKSGQFETDIVVNVVAEHSVLTLIWGEPAGGRDDKQAEECTSGGQCANAQVSLWYLTLTTIQPRISHIYLSMNSMYTLWLAPCLQSLCKHTDTLSSSGWRHCGQCICHPEMWGMWPWEEQWATSREGMITSSDEAQVSSWLLISHDSLLYVSMHITLSAMSV